MPEKDKTYKNFKAGSEDLIARLVEDHAGWAEAIARSVARAWNLDWQLDGLDGGAYEALLFCARRYDPTLGVPFRAYARKRIHESSTEEARKSKSWQYSVGANNEAEQEAREISAKLFEIYPELREGLLPANEMEGEEGMRTSIRQLLASASVIAAFKEGVDNPEVALQYKQMLEVIATLDHVHQAILWGIYWQGSSMRGLADEWRLDELTIIREHKVIIKFVQERLLEGKRGKSSKPLKIRPALRPLAQHLLENKEAPPFARFATVISIFFAYWANNIAVIYG